MVVTQLAARLLRRLRQLHLDGLQFEQDVMGGAIQKFALFGKDEATGMAMEQLDADVLLQRRDLAADRGLRQMKLVGCMGEGPGLSGRVENTQLVPVQRHAAPSHRLFRRLLDGSDGG